MATATAPQPAECPLVFVSYSKHDRPWLDDYLLRHLEALEQEGLISAWTDNDIDLGGEWLPRIVQAMRDAEIAICMISANYLKTPFCVKEEIPYLLERQRDDGLEVIFVLLSPCNWEAHPWLRNRQMLPRKGKSISVDYHKRENEVFAAISRHITKVLGDRLPQPRAPEVSLQIREVLQQLNQQSAAQTRDVRRAVESDLALSFEAVEAAAWPGLPEARVDIGSLPVTGAELFGRQGELALLDEAWDSEKTNVVSLVAWGGVGKSTLVNKWLEALKADNWRGAQHVLGWSFYSQGTGERASSADLFIDHALRFFGDPDPTEGSPWSKGERLAELVCEEKTLLVLDGLEPLQDPYQGVKDPGLRRLIEELARGNAGLCVITTREPVKELTDFPDSAIARDLEQISPEAGRALLRVKGVRGTDIELEQASAAFGNHALAINLLANFLRAIPGHPIAAASKIPDLEVSVEQGRHPRRMMAAFARRFREDSTEVEVLRLLGLFDRPATAGAIGALRKPPLPGLTAHVSELDEASWLRLLESLREIGLVAPKSYEAEDEVDAHPLVREHFGEELWQKNREAWGAGHERLYEYFEALPAKEQPDTLGELAPLFQAVFHGCQAGRHQETLDKVYKARICRGDLFYLTRKLGAFGADLAVLAGFFDSPWEKPVASITDPAFVLNQAGFRLRALGRLGDAVQPMRAALGINLQIEAWRVAALSAGKLSALQLTLGKVTEAIALAEQSVAHADRSGSPFSSLTARTELADALHQAGERTRAEALFEEAERLQQAWKRHRPQLDSVRGYRYCDLLLDLGRHAEVRKRAAQTVEWAGAHNWLLEIALDQLSLGRAELVAYEAGWSGDLVAAESQLNKAVDGLRKAGDITYLPHGLLTRAAYFRIRGQYDRARRDLDGAMRIATRSGMPLFECDVHLELARLALAEGEPDAARSHLARAGALVEKTGYHRRDEETAKLQAELSQPS